MERQVLLLCVFASLASGCLRKRHDPDKMVARITTGTAHACAEMMSGKLVCWGDAAKGQLREREPAMVTRPAVIAPSSCPSCEAAIHVTATGDVTATSKTALLDYFGAFQKKDVDALVGGEDVLSTTASSAGVCRLAKSGVLACRGGAGSSFLENLGGALPHFSAFALSSTHACGITIGNGEVRCHGGGSSTAGTLSAVGHDPTRPQGAPFTEKVPTIAGALAIATGEGFSCVLEAGRSLSCWGKNDVGQLGDGTRAERSTPGRVARLEGVHAFAIGRTHACAILHDWTTWCWGDNAHGELADGTRDARPLPVMIPGLFDAAEIALGDGFTCVRTNDRDRSARCWGKNDRGQAGDGTTSDRPVPSFVKF